jgi:hypothetical protein
MTFDLTGLVYIYRCFERLSEDAGREIFCKFYYAPIKSSHGSTSRLL